MKKSFDSYSDAQLSQFVLFMRLGCVGAVLLTLVLYFALGQFLDGRLPMYIAIAIGAIDYTIFSYLAKLAKFEQVKRRNG